MESIDRLLNDSTIDVNEAAHIPDSWTTQGENGLTALMVLCKQHNMEADTICHLARRLLDRGANVNQRTTDTGLTALHFACSCGLVNVVNLLLPHYSLDIDDCGTNMASPLALCLISLKAGGLTIARQLLASGAKWENARIHFSHMPLLAALASLRDAEWFRQVLSILPESDVKRAMADVYSGTATTVYDVALQSGHQPTIELVQNIKNQSI
eukprot:GILK01011301.1.p1 GENE.GILK01011301.1~~GILK01011301.1.p1  ORF type:complete len:241 (-),score=23.05 GILK01011301.1:501-1136(-)